MPPLGQLLAAALGETNEFLVFKHADTGAIIAICTDTAGAVETAKQIIAEGDDLPNIYVHHVAPDTIRLHGADIQGTDILGWLTSPRAKGVK